MFAKAVATICVLDIRSEVIDHDDFQSQHMCVFHVVNDPQLTLSVIVRSTIVVVDLL